MAAFGGQHLPPDPETWACHQAKPGQGHNILHFVKRWLGGRVGGWVGEQLELLSKQATGASALSGCWGNVTDTDRTCPEA
jgi:hypothetical protein